MCSVPPKFFQVCRLCLMLIEEHDISTHRIYSTNSVPNDYSNECKCNKKLDNGKCCNNRARKCRSCDKYRNKQNLNDSIPTILHSTLPRVPLSINPLQTYSLNIQYDDEYSDNLKELDICKQSLPVFNPSSGISDDFNESMQNHSCHFNKNISEVPKQFCLDDSSANIVIQILKCLSLEVSTVAFSELNKLILSLHMYMYFS